MSLGPLDAVERPEIARRVAWAGAGIDLKTARLTPAVVREAVARVLEDPAYRRRARQLGEAIAEAGGAPGPLIWLSGTDPSTAWN